MDRSKYYPDRSNRIIAQAGAWSSNSGFRGTVPNATTPSFSRHQDRIQHHEAYGPVGPSTSGLRDPNFDPLLYDGRRASPERDHDRSISSGPVSLPPEVYERSDRSPCPRLIEDPPYLRSPTQSPRQNVQYRGQSDPRDAPIPMQHPRQVGRGPTPKPTPTPFVLHAIEVFPREGPPSVSEWVRTTHTTGFDHRLRSVAPDGITPSNVGSTQSYNGPLPSAQRSRLYRCGYRRGDGPECGEQFVRPSDLKHHARKHVPMESRPYPCHKVGCKMRFHCPREVRRHEETHRGENRQKHQCDLCHEHLSRDDNLARHMQNKHAQGEGRETPLSSVLSASTSSKGYAPTPQSSYRSVESAASAQSAQAGGGPIDATQLASNDWCMAANMTLNDNGSLYPVQSNMLSNQLAQVGPTLGGTPSAAFPRPLVGNGMQQGAHLRLARPVPVPGQMQYIATPIGDSPIGYTQEYGTLGASRSAGMPLGPYFHDTTAEQQWRHDPADQSRR